jgi:hypothetical protein
MRCKHCDRENPLDNFYCGYCGSPLIRRANGVAQPQGPYAGPDSDVRDPVAPAHTIPRQTAEQGEEWPIAGPSFLGLAENDAPQADSPALEYLYEDEPRHYGRLIVALLILAGFGWFIAYQWKQLPNWYAAVIRPSSHPSQSAAAATPVSAQAPMSSASAPGADPRLAPESHGR